MCIKGRSPSLRHVTRTHRVNLDWLIERIKLDKAIRLKYVNTKEQLADIFTKATFSIQQWKCLLDLHQIKDKHQIGKPLIGKPRLSEDVERHIFSKNDSEHDMCNKKTFCMVKTILFFYVNLWMTAISSVTKRFANHVSKEISFLRTLGSKAMRRNLRMWM